MRKNKSDKVGLVSGGGSGHEPAHAGFVGECLMQQFLVKFSHHLVQTKFMKQLRLQTMARSSANY